MSRPKGSRDRHGKCVRVSYREALEAARKVSEAVRDAMKLADVSAAELAAALDVDRRTAASWASGRLRPNVVRLHQIAAALRVPVDHLVRP